MLPFITDFVSGVSNLIGTVRGDNVNISQSQITASLEAEKIKQAAKTKQIKYMIIGGVLIILIIFLATRKK